MIINTQCTTDSQAQGLALNDVTGELSIFPDGNSVNLNPAVKLLETKTYIQAFSLVGDVLSIVYVGEDGIPSTKTVDLSTVGGGGGGAVSGVSPILYNSGTGQISIQVANTNQSGALSDTDWDTFNNKVNDGANLGASGARVFSAKAGTNLNFRRLVAGTNITLTENANDIVIDAAGGGGGGSLEVFTGTILS